MSAAALIPQADIKRALQAAKEVGYAEVRARASAQGVEFFFYLASTERRGELLGEVELD